MTGADTPTDPAPGPVAAADAALPRFQVLDVALTGTTMPSVVATVLRWVERRERRYVCVFASDSVLQCHADPRLARIANEAGMVLTDGMPLVWLGRRLLRQPIGRCYGPDVMPAVIEAGCGRGLRHYFYGGTDEAVLDRLIERLRARTPTLRVAGRHSPPHRPLTAAEREAVVRDIEASRADVVWVGIGTPKQDYWVGEFRSLLTTPVLIAVGAAFDFHAGTVRQAPRWMMRRGLEWLFRLGVEPRRLWRRYVVGNPRFVALVLRQWLTGKPAPLGRPAGDARNAQDA